MEKGPRLAPILSELNKQRVLNLLIQTRIKKINKNRSIHTVRLKGVNCCCRHMAGVYCPSCEAGVEPAAKFCLSCGNDLTVRGPITATGHDLNQLKDVIRTRDDLSMAEKFDMIAKVEEGANPILLGIAAPADDDDTNIEDLAAAEETQTDSVFKNYQFGESAAASRNKSDCSWNRWLGFGSERRHQPRRWIIQRCNELGYGSEHSHSRCFKW